MLLRTLLEILQDWQAVFPRQRSYRRAVAQALGTLTAFGRRTLSRAIWAQGHEQEDWSADYKLHARANWRAADLFQPILARALPGVAVVMWSSRSMTHACTRRGGAFKALSTNMIRCLPSSFTT